MMSAMAIAKGLSPK